MKVAILWHMHQPYYYDPGKKQFLLPWVRLHGIKDYLDMPLAAAEHPEIKVTFNLVPSLLEQIQMYLEGVTDRHQELSSIPANQLSVEQKREILETFFAGNPATMLEPYARFRQLYRKRESCGTDINLAIELYSTSEWRDLQVWSNLVWIDPKFRSEPQVAPLFEWGRDFSEEDKKQLLDFQLELLGKIIPTYQKLLNEGKIDISFTPYFHPILPLLVDTDSAKEAIPNIVLPTERFVHPEDARWHIRRAKEKFRELFGRELKGMWPSEGSVSEAVLSMIREEGISWVATDEEILYNSASKSGRDPRKSSPHTAYEYVGAPGLKLFFRDKGLSDKIGFVYSGWDADRAVKDFIQILHKIGDFLKDNLSDKVVTIILDGENAWEYYAQDGAVFLQRLYSALAADNFLETVCLSGAAEDVAASPLQSISSGSWINHNFRIWIGHNEDNAAWDALSAARRSLVEFQKSHPEAESSMLEKAWRQIYIAEGSDWCWWYGDDHIGADNEQFDQLFRLHLTGVYDMLGLKAPLSLSRPIHRVRTDTYLTLPEAIVTPEIDGLLTHYYEWSGAGHYDCLKTGGSMHRVDRVINDIYFAFDHERFYIRLDFNSKFNLVEMKDCRAVVDFKNIGRKEIQPASGNIAEGDGFHYAYQSILEIAFDRKGLLPKGNGKLEFSILFYQGSELLEKWPTDEVIAVELPERDREIFWQV